MKRQWVWMVYQPKLSIKLVMAGVVLAGNLGSLAQVRLAGAAGEGGPAATAAKLPAKPLNGGAPGVPKTATQPPAPEMLPPQAPQVTYQDGMLSINAANSTFGEALEMDVAYVRGWSLGLDLRLLFRTPTALLRQRRATA